MKAVIYSKFGGPESLDVSQLSIPEPGPGEILVKVFNSSVNPIDWKIATGKLWPVFRIKLPGVPGADISGEVFRIGSNVTGLKVGDRVNACLASTVNASAEYAVATSSVISKIPTSMDYATAAALPLAGLTGLRALRDKGGMPLQNSNQRILIVGASGGVGHIAVQVAKSTGATVAGVCSGRNVSFVKSLGIEEIYDYTKPDPYKDLPLCDIILDCVGHPHSAWLPYLKPNGRYVALFPPGSVIMRSFLNPFTSQKVLPYFLVPTSKDLDILNDLWAAGKIKVTMKRFPLDNLRGAWEESIAGRTVGKLVIDLVDK